MKMNFSILFGGYYRYTIHGARQLSPWVLPGASDARMLSCLARLFLAVAGGPAAQTFGHEDDDA